MSTDLFDTCINNTTISNSSINYYKLIAFINGISGAKQGWNLAKELKQLNISVYNLKDLSVNETIRQTLCLELYKYKNNCIILICGGDGTNTWSTSLIDTCISNSSLSIPYPICVPIPMGTGNDLSRTLGWGNLSKQPNAKIINDCIADILFASQISQRFHSIDRWGITYTFNNNTQTNLHLPNTFLCYLSIGYDAFITHKFEEERRRNPNKFKHQIKNQSVYIKHGLKELFKPSNPITDYIDVIIDNKLILLSDNCRSLKLININSAANGTFFWGKGKSKSNEFKQKYMPRLDDGIIEVMTTNGVKNMLKCKTSITHAERVSQTNNIIIKFKKIPDNIGIALQIDGEAFIIKNKCSLSIQLYDKLTTVIGYNKPRGVQLRYNKSGKYKHIIKTKNIFRQTMKGILSSN
eukprot:73864_1